MDKVPSSLRSPDGTLINLYVCKWYLNRKKKTFDGPFPIYRINVNMILMGIQALAFGIVWD